MEKDFWLNKWKEKQIGFHQSQYNAYLTQCWDKVKTSDGVVFVPLCGKTKDMLYLIEAGHKVIGVELSEAAVKEFFTDNNLQYSYREQGAFKVYFNERIALYVGDMFELKPEWLSSCEYVYDRASIVALPLEMRKRYASFLIAQKSIKRGLTIVMSFNNPELGPPFSINETDLNLLFDEVVRFDLLMETIEKGEDLTVHAANIDKRIEQAYLFERFN